MRRSLTGKQMVKLLTKNFNFEVIGQKGSHIKLSRYDEMGNKITTIVPNHKELATGTIKGILKLGRVDEKKFWNQ